MLWIRESDDNYKWVQNFCENAWVSADGRVYTHSHWDEGSRAGGIYQNGDVVGQLASPTKVVFERDGAIVGDDTYIYATSTIDWTNWQRDGFGIRRFHMSGESAPWSEGEGFMSSYLVITETGKPPSPAILAVDPSRKELFVFTGDSVLVFDTQTMSRVPVATIPLAVNPSDPEAPRLHDMISDREGKLWIMRSKSLVERTDHRMVPDGLTLSGDFGENPRLGMARDGRLMVWDDRLLQVRFYSNPGTAQQSVTTFGAQGGTGDYWRVWTYQFDSIPTGTTHFQAALSAVGCSNFWDITLGSITFNLRNELPELAAIGNKTIRAGSELRFEISATDADDSELSLAATGAP